MKVVALNGSPKVSGNTFRALRIVLDELERGGVETNVLPVGAGRFQGCTGCGGCGEKMNRQCVIDDGLNPMIAEMADADGILLGSPVYFSGISSQMKSALDRAFYVASENQRMFSHKVAGSVAVVRRTGGMPALEQLNHYLLGMEMLVPGSLYWNVAHGLTPGDVVQDDEGIQTLRVLGKNMLWLLRLIEHGKKAIPPPALEERILTHFIR